MISENSKKHFEAMSREVNDCGFTPHEVGHLWANEHRYLQNEFAKCSLFYLFELGENYESGHYDARNELTAKAAGALLKAAKDGLQSYEDISGYTHYSWDNELSAFYYSYLMRKKEREQE